ncbi:hypothetical protein KI387_043811, partial [Taxus chinensis]
MKNASRKPNPPDRPMISPPHCQIALEAPPVNAICDTKELEEEAEIDETKEENMEDYENYLEVEEVNMHNGLIDYVDGEDEDDEEAPSFSCSIFTRAQPRKGASSSTVTVKDKKNKENSPSEVTQNKIISRGSPLPPSMESSKETPDTLVVRDHASMP